VRILVVSQYFPPEAGATQNRLQSFVDGLVARGHEVTVVCEQPNHPAGVFHPGFGHRPVITERADGLTVRRLWVAASRRKTRPRRLAFYGSFALGAAAVLLAERRHDVVFATSPPLPGALAAALAARARRTPFVLDVRDIWPAAAQALGELSSRRLVSVLERAERYLYRTSARVTATTRPFCRHIDRIAGRPVAVHLPNGARDDLFELPLRPRPDNGTFVVGYAGNLGLAQGLQIVFDAADRLRREDVRFLIVGDGPLAGDFQARRDRRELDAIDLHGAVPASEVGEILLSCDALLVPLRRHALLADFIPSKLYDAMAVGRPVILAATGEAAAVVSEARCGVVVPPEDGDALASVVRRLARDRERARALGESARAAAAPYARSRQIVRLEEVLADAAAGAGDPDARTGHD
jgi:glycosyltransferase involved in cell wall biosynthesis